jgi:hypothetical protein
MFVKFIITYVLNLKVKQVNVFQIDVKGIIDEKSLRNILVEGKFAKKKEK